MQKSESLLKEINKELIKSPENVHYLKLKAALKLKILNDPSEVKIKPKSN
jgi:hypothetical protein